MRTTIYDTMPQWGTRNYERAATYAWCKDLMSRKRGLYRSIGSSNYVRYDVPTDTYQIWYGKPFEPGDVNALTRSQWCKPIVAVHADDRVEILTLDEQGPVMFLGQVTGLHFYRRADKRSSHINWVRTHRKEDGTPGEVSPAHVGMEIRFGKILTPPPVVTRRKVNHEKAKPVRQMLADWKTRLSIVYLMRAPEYQTDIPWNKRWELERAELDVSDTFNADMAHLILQKAMLSTDRRVYNYAEHRYDPKPDYEARLIKRAIEIIREPVYKFNNVFDWKEAA